MDVDAVTFGRFVIRLWSAGHMPGDAGQRGDWVLATGPDVRIGRVYDQAEDHDGVRVLVDHIWPRGLSKANAALTESCKDV